MCELESPGIRISRRRDSVTISLASDSRSMLRLVCNWVMATVGPIFILLFCTGALSFIRQPIVLMSLGATVILLFLVNAIFGWRSARLAAGGLAVRIEREALELRGSMGRRSVRVLLCDVRRLCISGRRRSVESSDEHVSIFLDRERGAPIELAHRPFDVAQEFTQAITQALIELESPYVIATEIRTIEEECAESAHPPRDAKCEYDASDDHWRVTSPQRGWGIECWLHLLLAVLLAVMTTGVVMAYIHTQGFWPDIVLGLLATLLLTSAAGVVVMAKRRATRQFTLTVDDEAVDILETAWWLRRHRHYKLEDIVGVDCVKIPEKLPTRHRLHLRVRQGRYTDLEILFEELPHLELEWIATNLHRMTGAPKWEYPE